MVDLMSVTWVHRERRYFVSSSLTTLLSEPYERIRWRPIGGEAKRVLLAIKISSVAYEYYECYAAMDTQNHCSHDDLTLEHKLVTHDWSKRTCMSLLGMRAVTAWMLHTGARGSMASLTQKQLHADFAAHLIGTYVDAVGVRARGSMTGAIGTPSSDMAAFARYGLGIYVEPPLKRRGASPADGDQRAQRGGRVSKRFESCLVFSGCRVACE